MKKLIELIEVRKLIALSIVAVFIFMSVTGKISPENSFAIIVMVISFYFAKKDRSGGEGGGTDG